MKIIDQKILKTIYFHEAPIYGLQIQEQMEPSEKIGEPTLYPALRMLERKGYISSFWQEPGTDEGGCDRRRMYVATDNGRIYLYGESPWFRWWTEGVEKGWQLKKSNILFRLAGVRSLRVWRLNRNGKRIQSEGFKGLPQAYFNWVIKGIKLGEL